MATCARWKRSGQDRLYVCGDDGTALGWLDVTAAVEHVQRVDRLADFRAAVHSWDRAGRPREHAGPRDGSVLRMRPAPRRRPTARGTARLYAVAPSGAAVTTAHALRSLTRPVQAARRGCEPPAWHVLPCADGAHLVIGPAGIFTVDSKRHPGQTVWVGERAMTVDRVRKGYTRRARIGARRMERLLAAGWSGPALTVWPMISIEGAIVIGQPVLDEVLISPADSLAAKLAGYPRIFTADTVAAVYRIATDGAGVSAAGSGA